MFSRYKLRTPVMVGLLALVLAGARAESAFGQAESQLEQRFAVLNEMLNRAASRILDDLKTDPGNHTNGLPESQPAVGARLSDEAQLHRFAARYWGSRHEELRRALGRLHQLRPFLVPILKDEGLPPDLLAVVLIESAGRPGARSRRDARGLWQFIPITARCYGLSVGAERDERLDAEKATRAAARYFRQLYIQFGDWPLALAAYNAGEEAVQRAIGRAGRADFWILRRQQLLPVETRNYVPAVLAAMELLGDAGANTRPAQSGAQNVEVQVLYAWSAVRN